ncbi:valine--tRNA ligase [Candidatus Woesearchaeota archaeon]|nr:MAG: valine--tRNA ligase [Candidatus Woesearchaeota archaeon]
MELPKRYDPKEAEPRWQKYWEDNNIYAFDPNSKKEIFSIDTPPPTVSGKMHMGHAFGNSQQDFIARFKRMRGFNVLQPFGTDDNGLPTQTLIQELKKVDASKMDRKKFRELCLNTLENELKPRYIHDWKRLGISCDFNVSYSTIDPHCQRISQKSFLDLYKAGRQYRKEAAAIYCPKCQTAIAQVECEDKEVFSQFNNVIFKVKMNEKKEEDLVIATTRPELLPACVAVFYHPDDKRYQHLKNKKARVPLFNFEVPILQDERADPEKGTGIVMCCTFGDQTDVEWQKVHNLPVKVAIGKDGRMTDLAGGYKGLSVEDAREVIIKDLKEENLLVSQIPITHTVNTHERCGTPVEYIHSKQWFVKYLDLRDKMLEWGQQLNWYPKHMKNRYDNWVRGLQWDWCISRQIYFGIPFPVWYCSKCDAVILAEENDLPVDPLEDDPPVKKCPKCKNDKFIGEKDIINTWATSSLTPTIVIELFKGKPVYNKLKKNPMSMRPQGHDIISFWLFNTVVKSQLHFKMNPWHDCFINGWMLDPKGKKMSKSKGNIIEPQEVIEKYSADALRYMSAGSKLGDDLPYPEKDVITGQKTITKLWNACRFAVTHLQDYNGDKPTNLNPIDQWILSKFNQLVQVCTDAFERYEFSRSRLDTDKFFWQTFCDNYLELVKDRLYNPDKRGKEARLSAQYTTYQVTLGILKLFAPFMPFITEEAFHLYFNEKEKSKSIHITSWPTVDKKTIDSMADLTGDLVVDVVSAVRKYKSELKLSLKTEVNTLHINCKKKEHEELLKTVMDDIKAVTTTNEIVFDKKVSTKCSTFPVEIGIEIKS